MHGTVNQPEQIKINDYTFEMTCSACPEQYDVFDSEERLVACVRLRWGVIRAEYLDVFGEEVYSYEFDEEFKGCFDGDDERLLHLSKISEKIKEFYERNV